MSAFVVTALRAEQRERRRRGVQVVAKKCSTLGRNSAFRLGRGARSGRGYKHFFGGEGLKTSPSQAAGFLAARLCAEKERRSMSLSPAAEVRQRRKAYLSLALRRARPGSGSSRGFLQ